MKHYQPEGWPTVIPRMFTKDVSGLAGFVKAVFGAQGEVRSGAPTELRIGDSMIMVSDGGGLREQAPTVLYVYVADVDATYQLALQAGALSVEKPLDTPYGDRRAMVRDLWGNSWQIATHCQTS